MGSINLAFKGRKNKKITETDLQCAMREFKEETGISSDKYTIINNIEPLTEIFTGTDGALYKYVYFIAFLNLLLISSKILLLFEGNMFPSSIQSLCASSTLFILL